MPIAPAVAGGLIAAGGSILGQGIGAASQAKLNKKTMRWNEKMYALQRENALADFAMQNEYNHPSSVMARLQEAGLNPNLVYDKGAASMEAAPIKNASPGQWNPKAVSIDPGQAMSAFYDARLKAAQIDNLKVINTVQVQEAALKAAQVAGLGIKNAKDQFDLDLARDLRQTSVDTAKATLHKLNVEMDKMGAETDVVLRRDEREAAMLAPNLIKAAEEILTMRLQRAKTQQEINEIKQRIQNLKSDKRLKDYEIKLHEQGIQKNDPFWWRTLNNYVGGYDKMTPQSQRNLADGLSDLPTPFNFFRMRRLFKK